MLFWSFVGFRLLSLGFRGFKGFRMTGLRFKVFWFWGLGHAAPVQGVRAAGLPADLLVQGGSVTNFRV